MYRISTERSVAQPIRLQHLRMYASRILLKLDRNTVHVFYFLNKTFFRKRYKISVAGGRLGNGDVFFVFPKIWRKCLMQMDN